MNTQLKSNPYLDQHPWLKFAGMYQNNPLFSEVPTDIENNRLYYI